MALADTVHEAQKPHSGVFTSAASFQSTIDDLQAEVSRELEVDGFPKDRIQHDVYLNLRYQGTDNTLMILKPADGDYLVEFTRQHQRKYSFTFPDKNILLDDVRMRGMGGSQGTKKESPYKDLMAVKRASPLPKTCRTAGLQCTSAVWAGQTLLYTS